MRDTPLRVAFDVAELGQAYLFPAAFTGVQRVVHELARGLAGAPECEPAFCATGAAAGAAAFLRTDPRLRGARLRNAARHGPAADPLARLVRRINARGEPGLAGRAARRAALRMLGAAEGSGAGLVPGDVAGVDLYHSPFAALPSPAVTGRARRVLFVHDVIPLLRPDYFADGERALAPVVASLRPDDFVTTNSECTRRDLLSLRPDLDPARVFVTPLAADPARFHSVDDPARLAAVRARYGVPEGDYLLAVNTLEPRKNLDALVRAFARLVRQERAPGLTLVLAGRRGWKTEALFAALAQAGPLRERIVLAGYVRDEDLAPLYSGALAFVYPSLYEGFGLPPLEAMQCGTPVVTSNVSALPEVVGGAGIMVDPLDVEELAGALLRVCTDGEVSKRMAAASLERAALFTWERTTQLTVDAYRAALAGG